MKQRKRISRAFSILVACFIVLSVAQPSAQAAAPRSINVMQFQTDITAAKINLTGYMEEVRQSSKNESHAVSGEEGAISNIHYVTQGSAIEIVKSADYSGQIQCHISEYLIQKDGSAKMNADYLVGILEPGGDSTPAPAESASDKPVGQANMGGGGSPMGYRVGNTYIGIGYIDEDANITATPARLEFIDYKFTSGADFSDEPHSYNLGRTDAIYRIILQMYSSDGSESWVAYNFRVADAKAASFTATPTAAAVRVNGAPVVFDAYTIQQNNYFKLRDLAAALSGSAKQFEVTWDKKAINLVSAKPYTPVGGELAKGDGASKTAQPSTAAIYVDGNPIALTAYTMNGNNYFKLRDIGKAFDFAISWDGANNTILIDTDQSYTEG